MQCRKVQTRLSSYLDDELDSTLRRSIENHLNQCAKCSEELEGFQDLDASLRGLARLDMDPEFAEHLVAKVCKESVAVDRTYFERRAKSVLRFFESFFELLEPTRSPRTRSLEEFNDFPPLSIGYLYCKVLGQC